MANLITVRSTKIHDRVVLYELHPDHPSGKGWVIGNGKPIQVAHTARVNRLIGNRSLEIVDPETEPQILPVTPPFADYDALTVAQIVERLSGLSAEEKAAVLAYEAANKGRKGILEA